MYGYNCEYYDGIVQERVVDVSTFETWLDVMWRGDGDEKVGKLCVPCGRLLFA